MCCKGYADHNSYRLLRHLKKHYLLESPSAHQNPQSCTKEGPSPPRESLCYSPISSTEIREQNVHSSICSNTSDSNITSHTRVAYSAILEVGDVASKASSSTIHRPHAAMLEEVRCNSDINEVNGKISIAEEAAKNVSMCVLSLPSDWLSDSDCSETEANKPIGGTEVPHDPHTDNDNVLIADEHLENVIDLLSSDSEGDVGINTSKDKDKLVTVAAQHQVHSHDNETLMVNNDAITSSTYTCKGDVEDEAVTLVSSPEVTDHTIPISSTEQTSVCSAAYLPLAPRVTKTDNTQTVRPFVNDSNTDNLQQYDQAYPTSPLCNSSQPALNANVQIEDGLHSTTNPPPLPGSDTDTSDKVVQTKYSSMVSNISEHSVVCRLCGVLVCKSKESLRAHFLANHRQLIVNKLHERVMKRRRRTQSLREQAQAQQPITTQPLQAVRRQLDISRASYIHKQHLSLTEHVPNHTICHYPPTFQQHLDHRMPRYPPLEYPSSSQYTSNLHSSIQPVLLTCPNMHCTYKTTSTSELTEHIGQYHQSGLIFCDQCDYSTLYENDLKSHQTTYHSAHCCQYCPYTTSNNAALLIHTRENHLSDL